MNLPHDLVDRLVAAQRITVMTGAGISAESGIATFRDSSDSLWAQYRPEQLATPEAFERDPALVWNWYQWRREQVIEAQPNRGHLALVELADQCQEFNLITQNVDRLHQRAGSKSVIELHGNIMESHCHLSGKSIAEEQIRDSSQTPPPSPHHPQGLARPSVVWFGESLPPGAFEQAVSATACDVFFSIGTSSVVQPAASLAMLANEKGATVVEVNPVSTPLTDSAHFVLPGPAGDVLPTLIDAVKTAASTV